eukprot:CAMPEP_0184993214 /NCGR_PEP_ID=MMETSP1098-20130426/44707_1 /TAXON_ID=89044 /ORGANISM="Spumella elongata, Strain CCAP 955/1" /LENGTH=147 /DNA_ID=CAMNT_0027519005 /DNA_START=179 /DNA_END=622 /DNA_ORIENTATION=-
MAVLQLQLVVARRQGAQEGVQRRLIERLRVARQEILVAAKDRADVGGDLVGVDLQLFDATVQRSDLISVHAEILKQSGVSRNGFLQVPNLVTCILNLLLVQGTLVGKRFHELIVRALGVLKLHLALLDRTARRRQTAELLARAVGFL